MKKLLDRLALLVSMNIWFFISYIFFNSGWEIAIIFWTLVIWAICKWVFLSESFIEERISHFAEVLKREMWEMKVKSLNVKENDELRNFKAERLEVEKKEYEELEEERFEKKEIEEVPSNLYLENKEEKKPSSYSYLEEKKKTPSYSYLDEYKEEKNYKPKEDLQPNEVDMFFDKLSEWVKKFFSENLLAKIGAILVFLSVIFLMSLIWDMLAPSIKIIIWFVIGFTIFWVWVFLDKKNLKWESRIMLWAWILINFAVILAWRYLLEVESWWYLLGESLTFIFLILNTVFGVVTSLAYQSKTMLLFSFIFAYLNPFLIWADSSTPYTLVGYSMIVSAWALFLWHTEKDNTLKYSAFILWNLLFLAAPFSTDKEWVVKLVASGILWLTTMFSVFNKESLKNEVFTKNMSGIFILNYIFIILLLFSWSDKLVLGEVTSFVSYMVSIVFFFGVWIFLFTQKAMKYALPIFILPLVIILGLITSWEVFSVTFAFALIVMIYLLWFSLVQTSLSNDLRYIFFVILWIFIAISNGFNVSDLKDFSFIKMLTISVVSFIFLFTSYYFATKKGMEYLYSIWTIFWVMILLSIVNLNFSSSFAEKWNYPLVIWVISIVLFAISNWVLPFLSDNLTMKEKNIKNLIVWSIVWILFISFELFLYWDEYFPWMPTGYAFVGLSLVYFSLGYALLNKIWFEEVKKSTASKNSIYTYIWISISLFSLATALIFSDNDEVISTVWLFEASVMFYFFSKTKESKIFVWWLILFIIWVFDLFTLLNVVKEGKFVFLIPFTLIFASFVYNLKSFETVKDDKKIWGLHIFHDIFHMIWIWVLAGLLVEIIPSTGNWWSMLGITVFCFISSFVYAFFSSKLLKWFYTVVFLGFLFWQLTELDWILNRIDSRWIGYLRILQYMVTAILWSILVVWYRLSKEKNTNMWIMIWWFVIYTLIIFSMYVYDIFNITFAITIFWWVVCFLSLFYGISADKIRYRTIWLYLLVLILAKIFLGDILASDLDAISRVIALMLIWIFLIVISIMYSKKYGSNLKGEFDFGNIVWSELNPYLWNNIPLSCTKGISSAKNLYPLEEKEATKWNLINEKIKDIDDNGYKSVQFIFRNKKRATIKAKSLIKIAILIKDKLWKTDFEEWELKEIYDFVVKNYSSELSKDDYEKVVGVLKEFVEEGGEVKFKRR